MNILIENFTAEDMEELLRYARVGANNSMIGIHMNYSEISDDELDRPTGEWFEKGIGLGIRYCCSNCGHIMDKVVTAGGNIIDAWSNYCPNCGAKMKEGDSNN